MLPNQKKKKIIILAFVEMVEISLSFFFLSLSPSFKSLAIQLGSVWGRGGEICEKLGNCEAKSPRSLLRSIQSAKEDVPSLVHSVEGLKKKKYLTS